MDRNEKEKQLVSVWGKENCSEVLWERIDKSKESYFLQRTEELYIKEYGFETFPELMEELDRLWENDQMMEKIKKVIGVAAMKGKPVKREEEKQQGDIQEEKNEKLPVFIYNF